MNTDQGKVLKVFGALNEANSTLVGIKAGLGSDYANYMCQSLTKEGFLELVSEKKPVFYRITEQGQKVAQKASEEEAAKKKVDWEVIKCAFCRGTGRDPFGLLSYLSNCPVCHGRGTVRVAKPYETCKACEGTGLYFKSKMYCWTCRGKGVVTVRAAE